MQRIKIAGLEKSIGYNSMKPITNYYNKKKLIGIKISNITEGSTPITSPDQPFQIVTLKHKKGSYLKAHTHIPKKRQTERLQECLFVKRGKIKIDLYNSNKKYLQSLFLKEGQIFLLIEGGYGIHIIEDSEIFEFKNGPFLEDKQLI